MIQIQNSPLKPIIDSSQGLHLTAYIENTGNLIQLKKQLRESIEVAKEFLAPVLTVESMKKFLAPVEQLASDGKMLKRFRHNIGVFRTPTSFRVINIPVQVELTCVVATTFHVKPILRWLQSDRDFLLLGVEDGMVSLYRGSQGELKHIDSILFPEAQRIKNEDWTYQGFKKNRILNAKLNETLVWINDWLWNLTKIEKPRLFIAGSEELSNQLRKQLKYSQVDSRNVGDSFDRTLALNVASQVRSYLKKDAKETLEKALIEFYWAEDMNLAKKNIFQIAKSAVQGKVRKLIIADGINIFGKLDRKTGGLSINPVDLDHEDDDLLDDLAQAVLEHGGEVIVAKREEIPKGRPVLAILENKDPVVKENYLLNSSTPILLEFRRSV